jgi:uncharacterized protein YndB with AHSA1/START domain
MTTEAKQSVTAKIKRRIPTLSTIGGGIVSEQFEVASSEVFHNLLNPNCGDSTRRITITITFKPEGDGEVSVTSQVKTTLAPQKATRSLMFVEGAGALVGATEIVRDRDSNYNE